jgi:carbamoyltransferase
MLADGKMVGWFQGGAEFGPRALGHRSILADPRNPGVRDFINSRIKFREDFRLFAPSVLADEANVYFDCDYESPYMILVAPVRDEWRDKIPSVVHRDHSARIQTVTEATDPKYYQLLKAFKELTGIPIVETPEQAIEFFLECDLDIPSISDYIVVKAARKSTGLGFENR